VATLGVPRASDPTAPIQPLVGQGRWHRVAPFLLVGAMGLPLAMITPAYSATAVLLAGLVLLAIVIAVAVLPWARWPMGWQAAPAMAFYAVATLLQYAAGEHAEFLSLTALPVIWLALLHTRRLLILGLVVLAVTLFIPPLLWPEGYREVGWETAAMTLVLASFGGLAGQHLVMQTRLSAAREAAAARQAKADRDLMNAYVDTAGVAVLVRDRRGRVTLLNTLAEQVLGQRATDLVHRTLRAGDEPSASRAVFEKVLAGAWPAHFEGDSVTATGERRRIAWTGTALVDEADEVTHQRRASAAIVAALRREREATDRLRELDRVKDDFVAMVSHDLRTPLTSIVSSTELLLAGDAGEIGPMQRRLLETVHRNTRRLASLAGDLLLLSRIESGSLRMRRRTVSLNEVVSGALEALTALRAADVTVELDLPDEPVLLSGDPDHLERMATNLVSNALKFTPPGGRVAIGIRNESRRAVLTVSDTGIGIPADELPHVFDRFYRSSRSARGKGPPGTGLGLSIAKSIVEQHRGTISVSANATGGTTFVVSLPKSVVGATPSKPELA
jgi:PAS domain S-box-containing protein